MGLFSQSLFSVIFSSVLVASSAWAQKAALTEIPMNEDTTISIKKGDSAAKSEKLYEIVDGTASIEGEPAILAKEAKANWTKACDQWKKETKELNQDNKIIALQCGKSVCSVQGSEGQVCKSEGSYKIKTKMN